MQRDISIFGATGSIGQSTIDLIRRERELYNVVALTGAQNIARLAQDAIELRAKIAVTADPSRLDELRAALAGSDVEAAAGSEALLEAAARPADCIVMAIIGAAGLAPTLKAAEQGTRLALANKEALVCAGGLLKRMCARAGTQLLPVDSEHSALFQILEKEGRGGLRHVTLTASGGAFRDLPISALADVTVAAASTHPNWDMGQRITIDSANMFNKALECIEAKELFDLSADMVNVVIHPQSIIHALANFEDGGVLAHLGMPDMRHAIGFALNYPERKTLPVAQLDLAQLTRLDFSAPDLTRWPALRLAREVMARGGLAGAVLNGAKEQALSAFIDEKIGFLDIAQAVEYALSEVEGTIIDAEQSLENVMIADNIARKTALNWLNRKGI